MRILLNLGIIIQGDKILLGMKKRGFGEGRWNGFGGKVKPDETIEQALIREMKEEASIDIISPEKVAIVEFEFLDSGNILEVHYYKITEYFGEPKESEEMIPKWFNIHEIPFEKMWPDDKYWMPLFLKNKKFKGKFWFKDKNTIINHNLEIVDAL
jgi:8-oxo-dGTP pyrophosphatase MutT (NUDIX family)